MHVPIDYPSLRVIWWLLMGALLIFFAIMDGFDLGIGMLLLSVGKTDEERRVILNSVGPVWEGNQVWLILGAGAIFAAWPILYAVSFSGLYFAMLLLLLALILRPLGFKYRSKLTNTKWRQLWDIVVFIGGFIPAFVFGVALGNVILGVPFHFDETLRVTYTGFFYQLFTPFTLSCGLVSVSMLLVQGGIYLAIKTENAIQQRAIKAALIASGLFLILFALNGIWLKHLPGYMLISPVDLAGPSNPLHKQVAQITGASLFNYRDYPLLLLVPFSTLLMMLMTACLLFVKRLRFAFITSSLAIAGTLTTLGVSLFPFILPSSSNPSMSLLVWDSSSSQFTLFIMLLATLFFLPIIILYTAWVYRVLRGKVTLSYILNNKKNLY